MKDDYKVTIDALKQALMLHTKQSEEKNEEGYNTIWYGFRKYCNRHPGTISRPTLKDIENRGWMSFEQAQKFCFYAGIRCPK